MIRETVDHKNFFNKSNLPAVISVKNEIARTDSQKFLKCLCEILLALVEIQGVHKVSLQFKKIIKK